MKHDEEFNVTGLYFSPTYTTKRTVSAIAQAIAGAGKSYRSINVTTVVQRQTVPSFSKNDIVVFGVPVYIGRVPNLMRDYFESIKGNGAIGIPVVVYGHRDFGDALIELAYIMRKNGFRCLAAAAFIGEHAFSYTLGGGRPDASDIDKATEFGCEIARRLKHCPDFLGHPDIPGNPYPFKFYNAKDREGNSIDIRKVKPQTDPEKCNSCGMCAMLCPMGAIDPANCALVPGICIKCGACIKLCRRKAKYFSDPVFLEHKEILEEMFTSPRKKPEIFW